MVYIHVALFKFKPSVSEQEVQDIFRKVIADIPKVPELKSVQVGVTMILKDKAALEAYKKEREQNRDKSLDALIEDVVVLDYEPAEFSWPAL
ncbi:hypothetical protein BGZ72_008043 [Mortierella alpina]|nr:hypothetical protein BGZ72_008043 [Mortierella alpina]